MVRAEWRAGAVRHSVARFAPPPRTASLAPMLRLIPRLFGPLSFATALLPGCSPAADETGPGDVTQSEAAALEDAAAMIEQRRLPEDTVPPAPQETGA